MSQSGAFPVIFFMLSFYAFAVALLYALAHSWDRALSNHPQRPGTPRSAISSLAREIDEAPSEERPSRARTAAPARPALPHGPDGS